MLLELQRKIIYGPVNSRRLGRSLGINILPRSQKICSFNCLYCQYGLNDRKNSKNNKVIFPDQNEVLLAVENALKHLDPPPAYLTFSGNGEPTLHPEFPDIVDRIQWLKKKQCPESKTAILSNSSTVTTPKIKKNGAFKDVGWEEALDVVAQKLNTIKDTHGSDSIGMMTSARMRRSRSISSS